MPEASMLNLPVLWVATKLSDAKYQPLFSKTWNCPWLGVGI